jgi:HAD superfamily hydrolase (TIGR01490 family)
VRAAFFDIDGTLTDDRTWKGFLDYFQHHNLRRGTHAFFLGIHYPIYFLYRLGLVSAGNFRGAWAANMAWYVRGYTLDQAQAVWDWSVERFLNLHWRADTLALLERHQQAGEPVVLVSSGPEPLIQRIACELGTEHAVGTALELNSERYTGRSLPPACVDEHKASLAQAYLRRAGLEVNLAESYAYADSISDLHLLDMVGNPTAVYPEEALRVVAEARGWAVYP